MRIIKKILKYITIITLYVIFLFTLKMFLPCEDSNVIDTNKNNVNYTYKV